MRILCLITITYSPQQRMFAILTYFDTIYHQSDSFAKDDLGDLGPAFGQVLCFATHPAPVWGVVATVHRIPWVHDWFTKPLVICCT